jgi:hypothetical protein
MIIGAAKSGTTTLFDALKQHPRVFCSTPKETHFFSEDELYARGLAWYQDTCFKGSKDYPARGEATPQYLSLSEKAAPRIKEAFRGRPVKFIAIFRDPVQRAYSHYWQAMRYGNETLSFENAVAAEDGRLGKNRDDLTVTEAGTFAYFRLGCYTSRLRPFLDLFSRDQFLFLLNEDLENNFAGTMSKLAAFLDVDPSFEFQVVMNNPAAMPTNRFLFNLLKKTFFVRRLVRFILPIPAIRGNLKDSYRRAVIKPFKYPPMDQKLSQMLRVRYMDQISQLESITGFDLSNWKVQA